MNRARYDDYIRRFNAQDTTAFDEFLTSDMHMQNGTLEFSGISGMKDHYAKVWQSFSEALQVERFVSDQDTLAVQLWAHFTALHDDADSLFGAVLAGETFDFRGVIMYQIKSEKFCDICVAYNSFTYTKLSGEVTSRGIPH
jgi:predicted ester cyclase